MHNSRYEQLISPANLLPQVERGSADVIRTGDHGQGVIQPSWFDKVDCETSYDKSKPISVTQQIRLAK
jgi:hypothetical protein